jgi:hypothetical protein
MIRSLDALEILDFWHEFNVVIACLERNVAYQATAIALEP